MTTYEWCGPVSQFEQNVALVDDFLERHRNHIVVDSFRGSAEDGEDPFATERQDFAAYWGGDLMEICDTPFDWQPRTQKEAAIAPAFAPKVVTSSQPSSQEPGVREISPIGRRYNVSALNRDPENPTASSITQEVVSPQLRGRAALIRPKDPARSTASKAKAKSASAQAAAGAKRHLNDRASQSVRQLGPAREQRIGQSLLSSMIKSASPPSSPIASPEKLHISKPTPSSLTASLRQKMVRDVSQHRPLGIQNTGIDCYCISVVQVLFRIDSWCTAFKEAFKTPGGVSDNIVSLIIRMRKSLNGKSAASFPDLRTILARKSVMVMSLGFLAFTS